jgi:succinylglutamate desuccinylase
MKSRAKKPLIGVVACVHGDEYYGRSVLSKLRKIGPVNGAIKGIFANKKAYFEEVRYIEQDLNRSFPGNNAGNYEERIATKIIKKLKKCDFVIDLHSSSTATPPFIILSKLARTHMEFIKNIPVEKVVCMPKSVAHGRALIDHCRCGISLEMGLHTKKGLSEEAFNILINSFANMGLLRIEKKFALKPKKLFIVYGKERYRKNKKEMTGLRNFQSFCRNGKTVYPVLITPRTKAYDNVHFLKATVEKEVC